ncbi:MAG: hypothetical protein QOH33_1834, partial [Paraburkholderia sp.]|nr:hypothetical protein [Paraburkholderia sp.]
SFVVLNGLRVLRAWLGAGIAENGRGARESSDVYYQPCGGARLMPAGCKK